MPTDKWELGFMQGEDPQDCQTSGPGRGFKGNNIQGPGGSAPTTFGITCKVFMYPGYQGVGEDGNGKANGFFLQLTGQLMNKHIDAALEATFKQPYVAVNAFWMTSSYVLIADQGGIRGPFTVTLESPVAVQGVAEGKIQSYTSLAINSQSRVVLVFKPGNTIVPML